MEQNWLLMWLESPGNFEDLLLQLLYLYCELMDFVGGSMGSLRSACSLH